MSIRRLPVYLLLDCSESMAGEAFEALKQGLASLISELKSNPMALETAFLSVITFGARAQQVLPLTEVVRCQVPALRLGSGTALGAALQLWEQCMARDVQKTTGNQKGDYKPICFIVTDGVPTDNWEGIADRIRTQIQGKKANVIALACGLDCDTHVLRRITETVLQLRDVNAGALKAVFRWVSASVSTASQKVGEAGDRGVGLPELPREIKVDEGRGSVNADDRFAFIHSRCAKDKRFFIMRFAKQEGDGKIYKWLVSHPLEDFDFGTENEVAAGAVSCDALQGPTLCPYCQSHSYAMCACGRVHCCPDNQSSFRMTCPWCGVTQDYAPGSFSIGRAAG